MNASELNNTLTSFIMNPLGGSDNFLVSKQVYNLVIRYLKRPGQGAASALAGLLLLLCLLPATALAAEGAPNSLYVGNQRVISSSDNITYWTTDASGGLVSASESDSWNVKYDPTSATLTLSGATIKGGSDVASIPYGSGIYAQGSSNQPVTLTIELIGENTITGTFGIYVNAEINASSYGTNATLTIMGDNNGSLEVSGSDHGIYVKSGTGNASLNIKNVAVTSSTNGNYAAGVYVMSSNYATNSPNISLSVDGGSLTASGGTSSDGILFYVGSFQATGATTSLTVSENAIVDARNGGISALKISETLPTPTPTGDNRSGIVFDGTEGTVYGDVELQEDLEIGEGESLTIPEGSSLDTNGKLTVNGGTLNGTPSGSVTYKVTGVSLSLNTLILDVGDEGTLTATITPDNASNKSINWESSDTGVATVDANGKVTAVSVGSTAITATAADGSGKSATCSVTVNAKPTYTITAVVVPEGAGSVKVNDSGTSATVVESSEVTLTATASEGYRFTRWTSSNGGTIADASSASTTFTMPAGDVTVTAIFKKIPTASDFVFSAPDPDWIYNNSKFDLSSLIKVADGVTGMGTFTVSSWQGTVVDPINAGTYTVKVSVEEGESYLAATDLTSDDWVFEIEKADPPYTIPTGLNAIYGETLKDVTLPDGWAWEDESLSVGDAGKQPTFKATFTPEDTKNYNIVADVDLTVTVGKADPTPAETPSSYTATVGDRLSSIKLPEGWTWEDDPSTILDEEDSYVFVAIFTPEDTDNYNSIQQVVMITVVWPEPEPEPEPTYYRVDLRPVEGATVILSADEVEEGGTLTFTIEIAEGYVADDLMVTVSQGIGKAVEVKPDEAGVYTVKEVDGLVTITVYGVTEEPATAIERVEGVQVYAHEGAVCVHTPTEARVVVISMGGSVVASGRQAGLRRYALPRGFYVVWVDGESFKVAN